MAANPYFEIQSGADKRRLELDDPASEVVVGRASECQWPIPSSGVSRRHARISRKGSEVTIEDVGSSNGTFVNNERLSGPRVLENEDLVRLGSVEMRFFVAAPEAGADATIAVTARPTAAPPAEPVPPPPPAQEPPSEHPAGTASTTRSIAQPPRPSPPAADSAAPPPAATAPPAAAAPPEPAPAWLSATDDGSEPTVVELLAIAAGSFLAVFALGALLIRFVF
jgi:predicted component of type VI protein secretion system